MTNKKVLNEEKEWDLPLKKNSLGFYVVIPNKKGYSAIDKTNRKKTKVGYVYFIRCENTNFYKIGVSTNPYNRLQSIDSGNPFELNILSLHKLIDPYGVELELKEKYSNYNCKKEWYSLTIDIAKEIMIYLHNLNVLQDASIQK
jgi:hypothetical protein